ncbi:IclR family transcriptional regulator [Desulfocastanea catecholica]
MTLNFKRVPAIEKCFSILSLLAEEKRSLGYSEIVRNLDLNKSTVFNILHTLNELDILEKDSNGQFRLGPSLFILGNAAAGGSELIQAVHPYLEAINNRFKLSAFFGVLAEHEVIIVDKADQAIPIKISSEVGMKIPVFAGVAGKALLAQLPSDKIDAILSQITPKIYTKNTIVDKTAYKQEILNIKESGIAYDREEYIEGLTAVAVSFKTYRKELQAVIWAVGLKQEFKADIMKEISLFLLDIKKQLNQRFSMIAGPPGKIARELN